MRSDKKSFFKKIIFSKIFLVAGVIILVLLTIALVKKMAHDYSVESEIKSLQSEIAELENTNNEFNQLVDYLSTDRFVEEEARTKLGMAADGEEMIVIKNNDGDGGVEEQERKKLSVYSTEFLTKDGQKKISNPARWWKYFFKNAK